MWNQNSNPANFSAEQLQYIYNNSEVGSRLRSETASLLGAMQQAQQFNNDHSSASPKSLLKVE